jgi:glycosyltransferase involved in cell wall biosynthesis
VRILALCADPGIPLDSEKGATVHLRELWRALARQGDQVHGLAAWRGGELPAQPVTGLEIHAIPARRGADAEFLADLRAAALEVADGLRPHLVWERLSLMSDVGREVADRNGAPLVVEVNAPLDVEAARYRQLQAPEESRAAQQRLLSAAGLVYCVSEALVPYARSRGADPGVVRVLPNGVDTSAFAGQRADGSEQRTRIGYVGSFKPWHGVEILIEAFQRALAAGADLDLVLIGDGPTRPGIQAHVERAGLTERVRFLGAVRHDRIPALLREVSIAVAPAPGDADYYFSPLKVYEYAAAGCAIVAPRSGQVAQRFHHAEDAWLVAPGSPRELSEALVTLAGDRPLRERIGGRARQRAREEFDWSRAAASLRAWSLELVGRRTTA